MATLLGSLVLVGCGSAKEDGPPVSGVSQSDHDGYAGVLLPKPYPVEEARFTDSRGGSFDTIKDTKGKLSIVFFGYIQCPDICQQVMGTLASAYARLDPAQKAKVQVLFVTTDPARDTPAALKGYLARLDPSFLGLTGPMSTIDGFGKPLGVFVKKGRKLPSGGYEVDHSTQILGIDGQGKAPLVWNAQVSPSDLAKDIEKFLASGQSKGIA